MPGERKESGTGVEFLVELQTATEGTATRDDTRPYTRAMRTSKPALSAFLVVLASLLSAPVFADSAAKGGDGPEIRVFEGQYKWVNMNNPGPLRAEFTATGENRWNVDFYFRFEGRERMYSGTAEGSLSQGELKGKIRNENGRRSFTFEADLDNGRLEGTHRETTRSRSRRTGTLKLAEIVFSS